MASFDAAAERGEASVRPSGLLGVYARVVTGLADIAFGLAAVLVLLDLLLLGVSVAARYVLHTPLIWGDELVALSLALITMLAAPKVLLDGGHVEVDILTGQARGRFALLIRLWSSLAAVLVALLLMVNGWHTAMFSKMIGLLTEGYLELPLWALQLMMPVGGALLLLAASLRIALTLRTWPRGAA